MINPEQIIVALDFKNINEVKSFLKSFTDAEFKPQYLKVGMELFYSEAFTIVEFLKENQYQVFLDLKIHDIPNTAKAALKSLGALGIDMINVHASGGIAMMQAAKEGLLEGAREVSSKPILLGVTILTSLDENILSTELGIAGSSLEAVLRLANNTRVAGLDGVVCSAREVAAIKSKLGQDFLCVCPGIRPATVSTDDQKRIETPSSAIQAGADYLVIGRAITQASDPARALAEIVK